MKYLAYSIVLTLVAIAPPGHGQSTSYAHLHINDIRARFMPHGMIGLDVANGDPDFEVPFGGGAHAMFAGSIWIGGLDSSGNIHLAALRFDQENFPDYAPGPLTIDGTASITPAMSAAWDQVWVVNGTDVALQHAYYTCLQTPGCDVAVEFPGYVIPPVFLNWPAMGDLVAGQDVYLAPFFDFDADGSYDPVNGDFPCILGDQALFYIFNDKLNPHASGGLPIGLEVHAMPFAFASNEPALAQTIFIKYRIINRGILTLHDTYVGLFTDFDLGNSMDDYVGSDPARNLWYVYNGDVDDETTSSTTGYGAQPPSFGAVLLQGPFMDADMLDNPMGSDLPSWNGTGFSDLIIDNERLGVNWLRYFNNSGGVTGDPMSYASQYFGYLTDLWRDETPMYYGGDGHYPNDDPLQDLPAHFAFPNDTDPLGIGTGGSAQPPWSELLAGNDPEDRRMIGSAGPFTLDPWDDFEVFYALVYARAGSGGPFASVAALQQRVDSVKTFFSSIGSGCSGGTSMVGVVERVNDALTVFPVPASGLLHIQLPKNISNSQYQVFDAMGRAVMTGTLDSSTRDIDISSMANGQYVLHVITDHDYLVTIFLKD